MIKRIFSTITFLLFLITATAVSAQQPSSGVSTVGTVGAGQGLTAKEMIRKMMDSLHGDTSVGTMDMEVVTPDWDRTISMKWWEKGESLMLVRILSPARDTGNGTLKIDNNLWNYILAFDETVHIPPAMMAQSWMGSDFTNDDIVRESDIVDDYTQVIESMEEIDGTSTYKILMTADPSQPVPWLTIRVWLRTEDLLPIREEYYNDDGSLARYMVFSEFKMMHDRMTPTVWRMVPLDKEGHYTEMTYTDIQFDVDVSDNTFTLQTLQNPDM